MSQLDVHVVLIFRWFGPVSLKLPNLSRNARPINWPLSGWLFLLTKSKLEKSVQKGSYSIPLHDKNLFHFCMNRWVEKSGHDIVKFWWNKRPWWTNFFITDWVQTLKALLWQCMIITFGRKKKHFPTSFKSYTLYLDLQGTKVIIFQNQNDVFFSCFLFLGKNNQGFFPMTFGKKMLFVSWN